ncbi:hypothetical protein [Hamadaea tsunoensis]|uniref:hypothetical protein n=1 Tax=Hamadaea tsunoensis TaxID=53368 RepID=UPI0012F9E005|nr:hypothetical protein [Hamadaea tsunoensis]
MLGIIVAVVGVLATRDDTSPTADEGSSSGASATSPSPRGIPSPSRAIDQCLLGLWSTDWSRSEHERTKKIDGVAHVFDATGNKTQRFAADGTGYVQFAVTLTLTIDGKDWKETVNGKFTYKYKAKDGVISYTPSSTGETTYTWYLDGEEHKETVTDSSDVTWSDDAYTCSSNELSARDVNGSRVMIR